MSVPASQSAEPVRIIAPEDWQLVLSDLITDPQALMAMLELDPAQKPLGLAGHESFPLRVPRSFVARMQPGDWSDPLLRQVWPAAEESLVQPELVADPLQEQSFTVAPGLLQKYRGRVLLTAAPHCAIHCRYCFRRHFDYAANTPGRADWQHSLAPVRADASIREVILSGGDPLANSDRQLTWLVEQLSDIEHLETLRIHTRLPVVIPQRVTRRLCALLSETRFRVVVVLHSNHARELGADCAQAFAALRETGATLLNQAVVLQGVNNRVDDLVDLSQRLFHTGVLPYYLHLPDAVAGTSHFRVSANSAIALIRAMRDQLPGYLVPRLVEEVPGRQAKTILA